MEGEFERNGEIGIRTVVSSAVSIWLYQAIPTYYANKITILPIECLLCQWNTMCTVQFHGLWILGTFTYRSHPILLSFFYDDCVSFLQSISISFIQIKSLLFVLTFFFPSFFSCPVCSTSFDSWRYEQQTDRVKQELLEFQGGQAEREARHRVTYAEEKVRYQMTYCIVCLKCSRVRFWCAPCHIVP